MNELYKGQISILWHPPRNIIGEGIGISRATLGHGHFLAESMFRCFTKAKEGVTIAMRCGDLRLLPFGRNLRIGTSILCRFLITFPSQPKTLQKFYFLFHWVYVDGLASIPTLDQAFMVRLWSLHVHRLELYSPQWHRVKTPIWLLVSLGLSIDFSNSQLARHRQASVRS